MDTPTPPISTTAHGHLPQIAVDHRTQITARDTHDNGLVSMEQTVLTISSPTRKQLGVLSYGEGMWCRLSQGLPCL